MFMMIMRRSWRNSRFQGSYSLTPGSKKCGNQETYTISRWSIHITSRECIQRRKEENVSSLLFFSFCCCLHRCFFLSVVSPSTNASCCPNLGVTVQFWQTVVYFTVPFSRRVQRDFKTSCPSSSCQSLVLYLFYSLLLKVMQGFLSSVCPFFFFFFLRKRCNSHAKSVHT